MMIPSAPPWSCCTIRMTVWAKRGSSMSGAAIRSWPASEPPGAPMSVVAAVTSGAHSRRRVSASQRAANPCRHRAPGSVPRTLISSPPNGIKHYSSTFPRSRSAKPLRMALAPGIGIAQPAAEQEGEMKFLHSMIRISDIDQSLAFFCNKLGLAEVERYTSEAGRYTLIFLAAPEDAASAATDRAPLIELTYNWDKEAYAGGRNFGHLAFA